MQTKHVLILAAAIIVVGSVGYAGVSNFTSLFADEDVEAGDDLIAGDDVTVGDDLVVTDDMTVDALSAADLTATDDLVVGDDSTFTDKLNLGGTTHYLQYNLTTMMADLVAPASSGFVVKTGNLRVGNGTPGQTLNGEDLYVEGLAEFDGMIYADGDVTADDLVVSDDATITDDLLFGLSGTQYASYDITSGWTQWVSSASSGYMVSVGNLKVGNGTPGQTINGEDTYLEGLLEVDGMIYADGDITADDAIVSDDATITDDLIIGPTGTPVIDYDVTSGYVWFTAAAGSGYNVRTGNFLVGNGTPDQTINGEDVYVEGILECDGGAYLDGGFNAAGDGSIVSCASDCGAAVLDIIQNDTDKPAFDFTATEGAAYANTISTAQGDGAVDGPKKYSAQAGWEFAKMIWIEINDEATGYWIPVYKEDPS